jgi:hypothetical protein
MKAQKYLRTRSGRKSIGRSTKGEIKMHRSFRALAASVGILTLSIGVTGTAAAQEKGSWRIEMDNRDQPSLEYRRGDKIIFDIGVGRAVGLWIAYPGPLQADGKATITIQTSSKTWTVKGELTNDHAFNRGNQRVTYFLQWDMGLSRPKLEFNNLTRNYNKFMVSLLASKRIVIVTKAGTIVLPRIEVKNARKQMLI